MGRVTIKDKTFETFIPEEEILRRVKAVADRINVDLAGKNPLFLAVLNGAFIVAHDYHSLRDKLREACFL